MKNLHYSKAPSPLLQAALKNEYKKKNSLKALVTLWVRVVS